MRAESEVITQFIRSSFGVFADSLDELDQSAKPGPVPSSPDTPTPEPFAETLPELVDRVMRRHPGHSLSEAEKAGYFAEFPSDYGVKQ